MAWFYHKELRRRCEIKDIKIVGINPPSTHGGKTTSEYEIKFSSSQGDGVLVTNSDDGYILKALKAYRSEFVNKKHEQLSLFKTKKKIVS